VGVKGGGDGRGDKGGKSELGDDVDGVVDGRRENGRRDGCCKFVGF